MEIAIDITPLESGHSGRGIGVYTQLLIESLQKYENQHTYHLFTRGQKLPNSTDLVHYPYFDPFFLTLPLVKVKPTVVTVHDLIPLVFPDKFPAGLRGNIRWQIQRLSLTGTKRIITDSKCSQGDVSRITGIDKNRIDVVYLAPDPSFQPADSHHIESTRKKYFLTKPYFLYVGDVNWNKNVPGLVRAFASVQSKAKISDYMLVLVGDAFTRETLAETKEIRRLLSALGIERLIKRVGRISNEDVIGLYSGAVALIQPSFYEGFGLPVLEAMGCGCPVVSSDVSSLREILGPSIQILPDNISSIAEGMMKVVRMTAIERSNLILKEKEWVHTFTWQKVARETVEAYKSALL